MREAHGYAGQACHKCRKCSYGAALGISPDQATGAWVEVRGQAVGQRDLAVTANTYSHVLTDERELEYGGMLR